MKQKLTYFLIIFFPVLLQAQEQKDTVDKVVVSGDLGIGQNFNLGEATVSFLKVISDSRCPRKVTCIWPGEAKILVGIDKGKDYFEKVLVISGGENPLAEFENLNLNFSALRPYPEAGIPIAPEAYKLWYSASVEVED